MDIVKYSPKWVYTLGETYESKLDDKTKKYLLTFKTNINSSTGSIQKPIITGKVDLMWRNEEIEVKVKTIEDYTKEIYLHLNKLSDTNIDVIALEINTIIDSFEKNSEDKSIITENTINRLFQSAKIQINFCHLYAHLFYKLITIDGNTYTKNLENKIKDEFTNLENMKNVRADIDYDKFCDNVNLKENYLGCYQFCVELYNYKVLTLSNIEQIINKVLLDLKVNKDKYQLEIIIECMCRLIETVYKSKRMTTSEKKNILKHIIDVYSNHKDKLKLRSRFIFEDIVNKNKV